MNKLRCRMGHHRWRPIRVHRQDARECSVCHERNFDRPGGALDQVQGGASLIGLLGGPGSGGGF